MNEAAAGPGLPTAARGARPRFENTRYNRQEVMPQLGARAQARLEHARVAVIGAGGVKSPMLLYLAAAGVGHIRVIDFDQVELSNLNRQILFTEDDLDKNKAEIAAARLSRLNSTIQIEPVRARVDQTNIDSLLDGSDVVVEGGDSLAGRLLVNDYSLRRGVPMVHASAQYNYGYLFTLLPRASACFQCIFPDLPPGHGGSVPVFGIATGLAGVLGASEVIKLITEVGRPIVDGILSFSGFRSEFRFIPSPRRHDCAACAGEASAARATVAPAG